jgi:site-specific DNA-cytosine methylase
MKVLELFSGSRTFSKVAEETGHETFSVDINDFEGTDYVTDLLDIDLDKIPFKPDIIWASPPCTGFSVASIGVHWALPAPGARSTQVNNRIPKTETARIGLALLRKTLEIIRHFDPQYWYIENPRGMMRKMPEVGALWRNTVTYCQYGEERMKPTDIWTNDLKWRPRPACKNGDPCHVAAPRGSRTGTQGIKGNYLRSKIPVELAKEIIFGW